jgi:hypothetical protein
VTEKAESLASRIDPVLLTDPATKRIYIQLNKVFGALGLSPHLMPGLLQAWREQIKVVRPDAQSDDEHLYLPLLMLPEFLDEMPANLLSQEAQGIALEYKGSIRGMKFSSLLITKMRQSGLPFHVKNLPAGVSEKDIRNVAAFIVEQPSERCAGYHRSPVNYRVSFNGRQVR